MMTYIFTFEDFLMILGQIITIPLICYVITRLFVFVPDLMYSIVKKVKNPSPIYDDNYITTELDLKTLADRVKNRP